MKIKKLRYGEKKKKSHMQSQETNYLFRIYAMQMADIRLIAIIH